MVEEAVELYNTMNSKLEVLKVEYESLIQQSEKSIDIVKEVLFELEVIAKNYSFESESQQISFYKNTSPYFYEKYLFSCRLQY